MGIPEIKQESMARFYPVPYAEGRAHPSDQIESHFDSVGRQISGKTYEELISQLKPDERLVAVYWTCTSGTGDFAPLLDSKAIFDYFEKHVFREERNLLLKWRKSFKGEYSRAGFWALPESEVIEALNI